MCVVIVSQSKLNLVRKQTKKTDEKQLSAHAVNGLKSRQQSDHVD